MLSSKEISDILSGPSSMPCCLYSQRQGQPSIEEMTSILVNIGISRLLNHGNSLYFESVLPMTDDQLDTLYVDDSGEHWHGTQGWLIWKVK